MTHSIQQARESEEVQCTLNILEQAQRYFVTVAFKSDSFGLKNALKEVDNAKTIMKNFPVDQLLTAKDLKFVFVVAIVCCSSFLSSPSKNNPIDLSSLPLTTSSAISKRNIPKNTPSLVFLPSSRRLLAM